MSNDSYQDLEKKAMDLKKKSDEVQPIFLDGIVPNRIWDMERNLPPEGSWINTLQKKAQIACAIQDSLIKVVESDSSHRATQGRHLIALDDCLSIFEDVLRQLKES